MNLFAADRPPFPKPQLFTSRSFLLANPQNHRLVFFLLEAFNNLVQYQFAGNHPLVYSIIRRRNVFYALRGFELTPPAPPAGDQDPAAEGKPKGLIKEPRRPAEVS
jgi:hypothetical protein